MLQSKLFTRTRREAPKDEVAKNAQLLIRAGYIDKLAAGVYSYLPLGLRVLKKIEAIIRRRGVGER
jgi:prolyl-tRNA synthetase